ncbi:hypothetical protein LTR06_011114 [Exophiala xenobiotica]|nr:hypothetical protein LTR06_011114 [Exophiala xenobiotica]
MDGPVDATEPIFTVPFQRNPYFVLRHGILSQIETAVYENGTVVLCGPSGMGKSQIAIEYAYRFRDRFPQANVLWIHAENDNQIRRTYGLLTHKCRLPALGTYPLNISQILENWIQREDVTSDHEPWLMVWDDLLLGPGAEESCMEKRLLVERSAQAFSSFHKLLNRSTSRHGALMVTARSLGSWTPIDSDKTHVKVDSFSREQSLQLLRDRRPEAWSEPQSSEVISFLLNSLDDVPLAITYTIAAIPRYGGPLVTEVVDAIQEQDEFEEESVDAELRMLNHPRSWPRSTLRAWNAVFGLLCGYDRQAVDLLSVISLLDSQHIPIFLLATAETPRASIAAAVVTMLRYSVIVVERDTGFLSVHPLIQVFVRCWLKKKGCYLTTARQALRSTASFFTKGDTKATEKLTQLIPHAKTVLQHSLRLEESADCADLLHHIAHYEWHLGHTVEAYKYAFHACDLRKTLLGEEADETLASSSLMVVLLRCLGRFDEALEINRQNVSACGRNLGPDHPNTLMVSNNMALILRAHGKFEEAECLSRSTTERCERVLGTRDSRTSTAMANLALILDDQDKLDEAETVARRVLGLRESELTQEHQSTMLSCYCLAHLLHHKGSYDEASVLYQRAYDGFRRLLGSSHTLTVACESRLLEMTSQQTPCLSSKRSIPHEQWTYDAPPDSD